MNKIKFSDVLELNQIIGKNSTKGLTVSSILILVDLKNELQNLAEKYRSVIKDIMLQYNIQEINGTYSWDTNDLKEEISLKLKELLSTEVEIKNTNLLEDIEVVKFVENINEMTLDLMTFVMGYLKK